MRKLHGHKGMRRRGRCGEAQEKGGKHNHVERMLSCLPVVMLYSNGNPIVSKGLAANTGGEVPSGREEEIVNEKSKGRTNDEKSKDEV